MSGPAKYILSLEKADPSAKTYAIQYKWDTNETTSVVDFSFNTPNSKVRHNFRVKQLQRTYNKNIVTATFVVKIKLSEHR